MFCAWHRRLPAAVVALLFCWSLTRVASAHIEMSEPPMRNGNQKTSPCEGQARGEPVTYEAGSTITVRWRETVNHQGYFLISFDPDGDDFDGDGDGAADFPASVSGGDQPSGNGDLVLARIEDEPGTSDYSAEVTLPNLACDNCTLQLIQNMGERTPTMMAPTAHLYFRCADLVLTGGSFDGMGGMGGMGAGGAAGGGGVIVLGGAGGVGSALAGMGGMLMGGMGGGVTFVPPQNEGGMGMGAPLPPTGIVPMPPANPAPPAPAVTTSTGDIAAPEPAAAAGGGAGPTPSPSAPPAMNAPVPSATPSASSGPIDAQGGGDDTEEEGGCFGSISPRSAPGAAGWGLLALSLVALAQRRRKTC